MAPLQRTCVLLVPYRFQHTWHGMFLDSHYLLNEYTVDTENVLSCEPTLTKLKYLTKHRLFEHTYVVQDTMHTRGPKEHTDRVSETWRADFVLGCCKSTLLE